MARKRTAKEKPPASAAPAVLPVFISWGKPRAGAIATALQALGREALAQPWFYFEAGRLSADDDAPVVPYLLDVEPGDLPQSLGQLQATHADRDGTFRLVKEMNAATALPVPEDTLKQTLYDAWPQLEAELERRSDGEKLDELLNLVRELIHDVGARERADKRLQSCVALIAS
jgi:hypothetical protein